MRIHAQPSPAITNAKFEQRPSSEPPLDSNIPCGSARPPPSLRPFNEHEKKHTHRNKHGSEEVSALWGCEEDRAKSRESLGDAHRRKDLGKGFWAWLQCRWGEVRWCTMDGQRLGAACYAAWRLSSEAIGCCCHGARLAVRRLRRRGCGSARWERKFIVTTPCTLSPTVLFDFAPIGCYLWNASMVLNMCYLCTNSLKYYPGIRPPTNIIPTKESIANPQLMLVQSRMSSNNGTLARDHKLS